MSLSTKKHSSRARATANTDVMVHYKIMENVPSVPKFPAGVPVPVPTPVTVGFGISVESEGLFKAIVDLFSPEEDNKKKDVTKDRAP